MSFLKNKKVLILGLLSDRSIAYGIAKSMREQGAELAFTYQMEKHKGRVENWQVLLIQLLFCHVMSPQMTI